MRPRFSARLSTSIAVMAVLSIGAAPVGAVSGGDADLSPSLSQSAGQPPNQPGALTAPAPPLPAFSHSPATPFAPASPSEPASPFAPASPSEPASLFAPQVNASRAIPPTGGETAQPPTSGLEATALLAGGCFWCVESDFEKLDGVISAVSGYTGGSSPDPSYRTHVSQGHYEAVQLTYDPSVLTYTELLVHFFRHIDPTDDGGQFCDRGDSYRTAIFTENEEERDIAVTVKAAAERELGQKVVTPVRDLAVFYEAEAYHQDFYLKNPLRYKLYRRGCGRDARLESLWGKKMLGEVNPGPRQNLSR